MTRNHLFSLFILLLAPFFTFAQKDSRIAKGLKAVGELTALEMPALDNKLLLDQEMARRGPGIAPKFAESFDVNINPDTHGEWATASNGNQVWRLRISSPTAKSLNLGFTKYMMPEGGTLILYTPDYENIMGPFTRADNEEHEQLWTPILDGDDMIVEVQLPALEKSNLQLELKSINHDFLGFAQMSVLSGSCNLDVICGAANGWDIVEGYRDIIQSVAVIGTGGGTFCTGFLVNNVNNDCTPFFMTANHCGITSGNAASLVAYWNFENSTCREPGSAESGGNGDGTLNDFNTGSIFRCAYAPSDMTLVELDDPISPTANAFLAGWSAEFVMPQDTIIAIHHPSTDEKRITFEFDPAQPGAGLNDNVVDINDADHVIIPDWDIGTTEPGSSGSPVFNNQKQVVGQLHGGGAACGNDLYDSYGWFNTSWYGGGTAATALRFWLDPDDTGVLNIPGKNCAFNILANVNTQEICAPAEASYSMTVSDNFASDVTLSSPNLPTGATAVFSPNPAPPGAVVSLTVSNTSAVAEGQYSITVMGTDGVEDASTTVQLTLFAAAPGLVNQVAPADGSIDQLTFPEYTWDGLSGGSTYNIQVANDAGFTDIIDSATDLPDPSYTSGTVLSSETTYYWRVSGSNGCGDGPWSMGWSFLTADIVCAEIPTTDVPIDIDENGTPVVFSEITITELGTINDINLIDLNITHSWVGDLSANLESPEGTVVMLFDESACREDNLIVSFDDSAVNTAGDFAGACDDSGAPAIAGDYQPMESLSAFNGEEISGTWILTISDGANQDGGSINSWDLGFCIAPGLDVSVNANTDAVENCQGVDTQFDITLGSEFANDVTLSSSGNPAGTTVTFSDNPAPAGSTVTVTISGTAAPGTYNVMITGDDGINSGSDAVDYTINGPPSLSSLNTPADGATGVLLNPTLTWATVADATSYNLQVAINANFMDIVLEETVTTTSYTFTNPLDENTIYYWRVTTLNDCGGSLTDNFEFTTENIDDVDEIAGNTFSIQPNPTKGNLEIIFDQPLDSELMVELYSIDGKQLYNQISDANSNTISLDLNAYPSGIYLVKLISENAAIGRKVILQK